MLQGAILQDFGLGRVGDSAGRQNEVCPDAARGLARREGCGTEIRHRVSNAAMSVALIAGRPRMTLTADQIIVMTGTW